MLHPQSLGYSAPETLIAVPAAIPLMATIVVQRPKLAWHERWFLSTLVKGLKITVSHGIKTFLQIAGKKP